MKNILLSVISILFFQFLMFSQEKATIKVDVDILEGNELKFTNFDSIKFMKLERKLISLIKREYKKEPSLVEFVVYAIMVPSNNKRQPKITFHKNQNSIISKKLKQKIKNIKFPSPLFLSINLIITVQVNSTNDNINSMSPEFPIVQYSLETYKVAKKKSIKDKKKIIINNVSKKILPLLSKQALSETEDKIGVHLFAKEFELKYFKKHKKNDKKNKYYLNDIERLTSQNSLYWRAMMEMKNGDQLIPAINIALLISAGEFDYARRLIKLAIVFSNKYTSSYYMLQEMYRMLNNFYTALDTEIKNVEDLDKKGNSKAALKKLFTLQKEFPNSSAIASIYFSINKNIGININNDSLIHQLFLFDPLHGYIDVYFTMDEKNEEIFNRVKVNNITFHDKIVQDFVTLADLAVKLESYNIAAIIYWNLINAGADLHNDKNFIIDFLYCMDRLNINYILDGFNLKTIEKVKKMSTLK